MTDCSPVHDIDDVTPTFSFSASLRVFGDSLDFDELERELSLTPSSHTHRKGEARRPGSEVVFMHDMWCYRPDVAKDRPLTEHIDALWRDIRHATPYLVSLKASARVDVFLGYRSDWLDGGVEVPSASLELFRQLDVPFSLSIIRL